MHMLRTLSLLPLAFICSISSAENIIRTSAPVMLYTHPKPEAPPCLEKSAVEIGTVSDKFCGFDGENLVLANNRKLYKSTDEKTSVWDVARYSCSGIYRLPTPTELWSLIKQTPRSASGVNANYYWSSQTYYNYWGEYIIKIVGDANNTIDGVGSKPIYARQVRCIVR